MSEPAITSERSITMEPAICPDRKRLAGIFQDYADELERTIAVLCRDLGRIPTSELDGINKFAEKSRARRDEARAALERHIAEHGCSGRDSNSEQGDAELQNASHVGS
jgi:hypothetical protein